jgi:hypothetical protein
MEQVRRMPLHMNRQPINELSSRYAVATPCDLFYARGINEPNPTAFQSSTSQASGPNRNAAATAIGESVVDRTRVLNLVDLVKVLNDRFVDYRCVNCRFVNRRVVDFASGFGVWVLQRAERPKQGATRGGATSTTK